MNDQFDMFKKKKIKIQVRKFNGIQLRYFPFYIWNFDEK